MGSHSAPVNLETFPLVNVMIPSSNPGAVRGFDSLIVTLVSTAGGFFLQPKTKSRREKITRK
jgi:hypothetical protein